MNSKKWTIGELVRVTTDYLEGKGIESPRLSSEILLAHSLGVDRINLFLNFDKPLDEGEIALYRTLIRRRVRGEPIQYITGKQDFWSMEFIVGPGVLIPRPESELLIETALSLLSKEPGTSAESATILDLGTGSGALAVALARELEGAKIWATDISGPALEVARENARRHGLEGRIHFREGDLFGALGEEGVEFQMVISNPPYVPSATFASLQPEIRDHEPRVALDGGPDGMDYIERIIREGAGFLKSGGWLLLEMDPGQVSRARELVEGNGHYCDNRAVKDFSHQYRVLVARRA